MITVNNKTIDCKPDNRASVIPKQLLMKMKCKNEQQKTNAKLSMDGNYNCRTPTQRPTKNNFHRIAAILSAILETVSHRKLHLELVPGVSKSKGCMNLNKIC